MHSNRGEQMDNELYHYGVKGMRWGVRRHRNEDSSLTSAGKRRNRIGVLHPVYSALIGASDKMTSDKIIKKSIDFKANSKKDDLEKLNTYNDYKKAGRITMTQSNGARKRVKDGDVDTNYKIMEMLAGSSNMKKVLNLEYDKAKIMHDYSDKKVNELMKKFKDVPIKEVDSYRSINYGNKRISWMGKKYVRQ